jgi:transposase InsO family protein
MVAFVDEHRSRWPVAAMCEAIELAKRTYYAANARPPSARDLTHAVHKVQIQRVVAGDITYASTWQGWLYIAFVLDVYSRAIVGWQIACPWP